MKQQNENKKKGKFQQKKNKNLKKKFIETIESAIFKK